VSDVTGALDEHEDNFVSAKAARRELVAFYDNDSM
jgi:hypothetical protein